MIGDHPVLGVGPNMVERVYVQYRVPEAEDKINPHLHNVPLQIAAERGLPALAAWLAFITILCVDLARTFYTGERQRHQHQEQHQELGIAEVVLEHSGPDH